MKLNLATISERVQSETDAYLLLEELRWHGEPVCPFCAHDKAYFLKPSNGSSRATGPKRTMSVRRVWKCAKCRRQFSVLTNTIFHGTKIPLKTWLMVLVQVSSAKNGISAREVERMHGITAESAWHMVHRIRGAMTRDPLAGMLSRVVVADETFIGGRPSNRHAVKRAAQRAPGVWSDKTAVVSLVDKQTREVRSQVVPKVNGETLRQVIKEHVDMAATVLHTDENSAYNALATDMAGHETVNHSWGEYVRDGVSTNRLEGYFSQLKRSIDGTHHHVSVEHDVPRQRAGVRLVDYFQQASDPLCLHHGA